MKQKLQKGFTLVELVVVMVLMGVIMTAVVMVLRPSQRTFTNITNKAFEEQITLNMSKLLNGSLRYATGIKVVCNDGSTPSVSDMGNNKSYIKLSNNYRSTSVKGARGDFERGRVNGGSLSRTSSTINSSTFDEYDFQFAIANSNATEKQESMTISVRAMAMDLATPAEVAVAAGIGKPNPDFIPNFDKSYEYSETFEFVNIRNRDTIGKVTTGVGVDTYNAGAKVAGLDDNGEGYYNPTASGVDNTIWIFFTNPNEAEDKTTNPGGGTPTPGGGNPGGNSGGNSGGTSGGSSGDANTGDNGGNNGGNSGDNTGTAAGNGDNGPSNNQGGDNRGNDFPPKDQQ